MRKGSDANRYAVAANRLIQQESPKIGRKASRMEKAMQSRVPKQPKAVPRC